MCHHDTQNYTRPTSIETEIKVSDSLQLSMEDR